MYGYSFRANLTQPANHHSYVFIWLTDGEKHHLKPWSQQLLSTAEGKTGRQIHVAYVDAEGKTGRQIHVAYVDAEGKTGRQIHVAYVDAEGKTGRQIHVAYVDAEGKTGRQIHVAYVDGYSQHTIIAPIILRN